MPKLVMPLIDGFEETEALCSVDLLRRANIDILLAGVSGELVTGSHQITIKTEADWSSLNFSEFDGIVIPGGPGVRNLDQVEGLHDLLRQFDQEKKWIAAICAGPSILAHAGILKNRTACCFPKFESELTDCHLTRDPVSRDGHIITSRGAGTTVEFALEIITAILGKEASGEVARAIQYPPALKS